VICGDEKGPVAAKLYPPHGQWAEAAHRPHYQPDYGRRGAMWLFGALNPQTGQGLLHVGERRDSATFIELMEKVNTWIPEGDVHVVINNLSIPTSTQSLLWNFGHQRFYFHFPPTGAAWLNLIECWWRILDRRTLEGRTFANAAGLRRAYAATLAGWNANPTPFRWDPKAPRSRQAKGCSRCRRLHRHHRPRKHPRILMR
jgi:DDE superfamily endonuclease